MKNEQIGFGNFQKNINLKNAPGGQNK